VNPFQDRRKGKMLLCGAVTLSLVVLPSFSAVAQPSLVPSVSSSKSASSSSHEETVVQLGAIEAYGDAAEVVLDAPGASSSSLARMAQPLSDTAEESVSVAQEELGEISLTLGEPAAGGYNSSVEIESPKLVSSTETQQKVSAMVTFSYHLQPDDNGYSGPSSWADEHLLTLEKGNEGWAVVADEVVPYEESSLAADESDPTPEPEEIPMSPDLKSDDDKPGIPIEDIAQPADGTIGVPAAGYSKQNSINVQNFVSYAISRTSGSYAKDGTAYVNGTYPKYNNNCANFVSQVLDQAGWYLTGGNSTQIHEKTKWTFNLAGIAGATRTWTKASNLYSYSLNTGRYKFLSNVWNARSGDLIFVDWDPNGYPDGYIDHVMAVTGRANYAPRISQKSSNRSNISLETTVALAKQQGKKYTWYGLDLR